MSYLTGGSSGCLLRLNTLQNINNAQLRRTRARRTGISWKNCSLRLLRTAPITGYARDGVVSRRNGRADHKTAPTWLDLAQPEASRPRLWPGPDQREPPPSCGYMV